MQKRKETPKNAKQGIFLPLFEQFRMASATDELDNLFFLVNINIDEKEITLDIAFRVAAFINANKGMGKMLLVHLPIQLQLPQHPFEVFEHRSIVLVAVQVLL